MASFDQHVLQRLLGLGSMAEPGHDPARRSPALRRRRMKFGAGWVSRLRDRPVAEGAPVQGTGCFAGDGGWSWSEHVAPFGVNDVRIHHHALDATQTGSARRCPAAGWGMIVSGTALLEMNGPDGKVLLHDVLQEGDVWSVPVQAKAWLACREGEMASVVAFIGGREAEGPGVHDPFSDCHAGEAGFHHCLTAQPAAPRPWGSLRVVEAEAFRDPDALSAALVEVAPGHQTDLHWHLNTAVWPICLGGEGSLTQLSRGMVPQTRRLGAGMMAHVPRAEGYYLRNDGETTLTVLEIFRSDHYHDLSLPEWLASSSAESIAAHLCVDVSMIARLSQAGPGAMSTGCGGF